MPVAFAIEALLVGAKRGYPAFHFFANGVPDYGRLTRRCGDFNRRFQLFNFNHWSGSGRRLRISLWPNIGLRFLAGDGLHKRHRLRD